MEWKMPTNRRKVLASALVIVFAASHDAQAQDVQRVDVREAGLVGHFYAAVGASRRTGLLMLTGSGGGYPDDAAARDLARAGYPAWTLNGVPLPYAEGVYNRGTPMSQFTDILDGPVDVRNAAAIEVEHIHGPVLLISSRADALSPSPRMANDIEARLRANGFSYRVENVQYENASHLLMGFGPGQTEFRVNERFTMHFGGTAEGTETARNSGWARVKEFLGRL